MRLIWSESAWAAYLDWQARDRQVLERINALIKDAKRTPFTGIGKPEPLKGTLAGWWSRRITAEHRLIYRITGTESAKALEIACCLYHY